MDNLVEKSVVSRKNAIVISLAVTFFLGMAGLSLYSWLAWRIFNPFELFVELLFAVVLIERAASNYQYTVGSKTFEISKQGLLGSRLYTIPFKDIIGIYRYRAQLVSVIRFRRTFRLHSALDGRPVWTIAYTVVDNSGKKENRRIYFKPSAAMVAALKSVLPGKVKIAEEEVVSQHISTESKESGR